ncbi:MAG TPA: prepilin-type N-terminal cleavage/methylation domain-containing protein [Candidatus Paceibacterota bacterium]|nr:prepilin-type N-terminal cleavage/methylation domain-containing protein [Candidatus Paceibacterota bacterium]
MFIYRPEKNNKKGFTLIELLVVVAIIGILSSVVLVSLNSARSKSRDAKRQSDIRQIQSALEMYYLDNGSYPIMGWQHSNTSNWNNFETILSPYIGELPHDPKEATTGVATSGASVYSYYASNYGCPGHWYMIVYVLENAKGPDPSVRSCSNTFRYGGSGANTTIKTVGMDGPF